MIFIFKSFLGNHSYNQTVDVNKSKVFFCCWVFQTPRSVIRNYASLSVHGAQWAAGSILQTLFINELLTQQVQMAGGPGY